MRWKTLATLLGLVLLAAIGFSLLGARASPSPAPDAASAPPPTETGAVPLLDQPRNPRARIEPGGEGAPAVVRPSPVSAAPPATPAPAPQPEPARAKVPPPPAAPAPTEETPPPADERPPFPIDKQGIAAAIQEAKEELHECYQPWLQATPELGGRIKVSFRIETDPHTQLGHVTEIDVLDGGIDHLALQGCVMNVFKTLRFDAPPHGVINVTYPLSFSTGSTSE